MPFDFKNKVILITGSSSGFGKALAERVVQKGAKVVLGDIDQKVGQAEADKLGASNAVFTKCDVTKRQDQEALFALGVKTFDTIDVVVNNAGIADYNDFYTDDRNDKSWELCLRIDLDGVIIGSRIAFDYFAHKAEKSGIIINTASLAGIYPQPAQPVYGVAKAGVVQLTRSMGGYGENYGIWTVAICPSFSPTGILAKGVAAHGESFNQATGDRVPVEQVIDAFILGIENAEKLNGRPVRVTPTLGIDVYTFGKGKEFKL